MMSSRIMIMKMTGVLTILAIYIGKVSAVISLQYKAGNLMLWFVSNTEIIRPRFGEPQQT